MGYAHPAQVRDAVRATQDAIGARLTKLHLHDPMVLGVYILMGNHRDAIKKCVFPIVNDVKPIDGRGGRHNHNALYISLRHWGQRPLRLQPHVVHPCCFL